MFVDDVATVELGDIGDQRCDQHDVLDVKRVDGVAVDVEDVREEWDEHGIDERKWTDVVLWGVVRPRVRRGGPYACTNRHGEKVSTCGRGKRMWVEIDEQRGGLMVLDDG